jgi:hypothetical protein
MNGYKLPVFEAVVRRTILKAAGVQDPADQAAQRGGEQP